MFILAGTLKGRSLKFSRSREFRPTQDKVRAAVLNILQFEIEGAVMADLCCGSGAIGIEAISRGAKWVDFVDTDSQWVKANTADLKNQAKVYTKDSVSFLKNAPNRYDLIYLDPPWAETRIYEDALKMIGQFDILTPNGKLLCEHHKKTSLIEASLPLIRQYRYGDAILSVFQR